MAWGESASGGGCGLPEPDQVSGCGGADLGGMCRVRQPPSRWGEQWRAAVVWGAVAGEAVFGEQWWYDGWMDQ